MSLDLDILAERVSAVERHLLRVKQKLPIRPGELQSNTDASDPVILHLWQAKQIVLDIALGACAQLHLGAPAGYADAFVPALARRLGAAAGFRDLVAHAYASIDLARSRSGRSTRVPCGDSRSAHGLTVALRSHENIGQSVAEVL